MTLQCLNFKMKAHAILYDCRYYSSLEMELNAGVDIKTGDVTPSKNNAALFETLLGRKCIQDEMIVCVIVVQKWT